MISLVLEKYHGVVMLFAGAAALLIAWAAPAPLALLKRQFLVIARKRTLSVFLVGLFALAGRAALLPVTGIPQPNVHDEFSYLFAADTFAHGRLANAPHPMWVHFETYYELNQPARASMYPPAQGLLLAAGEVLTGTPWVGVWLSVAAMCAAVCWMLQEWMPPQWALLGGVLCVLQFGLTGYWINSYWGGALPAFAAALILGAWARIRRKGRTRDAILMGVGLAILANCRPYEGAVTCIPVAIALAVWVFARKGLPIRGRLVHVVLPLAVLLGTTAAAMGYYNWRITGNPLEMPYQLYLKSFYPEPTFLWQSLKPLPAYRHPIMRQHFEGFLLPYFEIKRSSVVGYFDILYERRTYFYFFLNWGTLVSLLMLPWIVWHDRRFRFLLIVGAFGAAAIAVEAFPFLSHYAAPITPVLIAAIVQGLRHLRTLGGRSHRAGITLTRAIVLFSVLATAVDVSAVILHVPNSDMYWNKTPRSEVKAELEHMPGKQLAIVRYEAGHSTHVEWVYNEPDIDGAKIIWARDMGAAQNAELIRYYPDRQVWLIRADDPPYIYPYPEPSSR